MERARTAAAVVVAALLVGALGGASPPLPPPAIDATAPLAKWDGAGIAQAYSAVPRPQPGSRSVAATAVEPPAAPGDVVIAPPPDAFDAAPARPAAPAHELLAAPAPGSAGDDGGVWAVIIGVNDYPGRSGDLRSAVNDANDMDEALARLGVPAERRLVLRDGAATAEVIGVAADWLATRADADATAVFFYAGHVRKTADGEAIVAADGRLVSDADLAGRLAPLQAKAWIVMASCFGGGFTEVLGPGRLLTAAADADSLAYENSGFGRSYLVQYMVRRGLIEGNSDATAQDAFAYADGALRRDYPNRVPFQIDQSRGPVPLSMRTPAGGRPGSPAPPQPTQGPTSAPAPTPEPPAQRPEKSPPPEDEDDGACAGVRLGVVTCGP